MYTRHPSAMDGESGLAAVGRYPRSAGVAMAWPALHLHKKFEVRDSGS